MDPTLEFDCPKFYDFTAPTPSTNLKRRKDLADTAETLKRLKCSPTLAEKIYNFQHGHFHKSPCKISKLSLTKPQPFVLHTSERAEMRPSVPTDQAEYVPLSVQVSRWATATPPRLKREPVPLESRSLCLTVPKPFNLNTDLRATHHRALQPPATPTFARQFKATPLDPKILTSIGNIGVRKVEKKPCTVPEAFSLTKYDNPRPTPEPHIPFQFKANPMPLHIPFHPILPHRMVETTPFHLSEDHSESKRRSEPVQPPPYQFRAQPWHPEDFQKPVETPRVPKPLTEIQGFRFRSHRRAHLRAAWECGRRQNERAKQAALAQREREAQEAEALALRRLRRSLVHRPQPIGLLSALH